MSIKREFIAFLIADRTPVTVFLNNGVKLYGIIDDADLDALVLTRADETQKNRTQIIFMQTVATIMPDITGRLKWRKL